MKKLNQKKQIISEGYIPFNINKINRRNLLDSVLILKDGSHFFGTSFGAKRRSSGELYLLK